MADIERLKAFHQISSFVGDSTRELLVKELDLENSNLEKRIPGLTAEDEFALILFYLRCCKHIVSIDETTSVLTNESRQSDFILCMHDGSKVLVEVKSTETKKYKISERDLNERIAFSTDMGLDLYFAIKFGNMWTMYPAQFLLDHNRKIELPRSGPSSCFWNFFEVNAFTFPAGLKVESTYSKSEANHLGIGHEKHGNLISYCVYYNDTIVFEITHENQELFGFTFAMELLHDHMANTNLSEIPLENGNMKTVEKLEKPLTTIEYDHFLSTVRHCVNKFQNRYDFTGFLKLVAGDNTTCLQRDHLKSFTDYLVEKGVPVLDGAIEIAPVEEK